MPVVQSDYRQEGACIYATNQNSKALTLDCFQPIEIQVVLNKAR
jgi:hypothetical protein